MVSSPDRGWAVIDEKELASELEQAIDGIGLQRVLNLIANICHEKAEHVRTNWQDGTLARAWERDGARIERCASKVVP